MSGSQFITVVGCVAAVCSAYVDGRRLVRDLRRRRRQKGALLEPEEAQTEKLESALDEGNSTVRGQYDYTWHQMGDKFAVGDQYARDQLQELVTMLQDEVIQNLHLAWGSDIFIDFRDLRDTANESKDRALICLLELHQRLLVAAPVMDMYPPTNTGIPARLPPRGPPPKKPPPPRPVGLDDADSRQGSWIIEAPSFPKPPTMDAEGHQRTIILNAYPSPTSPHYSSASSEYSSGSAPDKIKSSRPGFFRRTRTSDDKPAPKVRQSPQSPPRPPRPQEPELPLVPQPLKPSPPQTFPRPPSQQRSYPTPTEPHPGIRRNSFAETISSGTTNTESVDFNPWHDLTRIDTNNTGVSSATTASPPSGSVPSAITSISLPERVKQSKQHIGANQNRKRTFTVPGDNQRPHLPSEENKYQGLCKCAWRYQTGQLKNALKDRCRPSAAIGVETITYWSCSKCDFEGKLMGSGKAKRLDQSVHEVTCTSPEGMVFSIRWRWLFLFKSHFPTKIARQPGQELLNMDDVKFGCVFCCAQGRPMTERMGVKKLMEHLAGEHVGEGRWPEGEVLYRMNTKVKERASETDDWDLNLAECVMF